MTEDVLARVSQKTLDVLTDEERTQLTDFLTNQRDGIVTKTQKEEFIALKNTVEQRLAQSTQRAPVAAPGVARAPAFGMGAMSEEDLARYHEIKNKQMGNIPLNDQDKEDYIALSVKYNMATEEEVRRELEQRLSPRAGSESKVDPLATTAVEPVLKNPGKTQQMRSNLSRTEPTRRLKRENKITKSYLQQIIKEELLVILTDDEVKEMFGIDISEG